MQDAAQPALPPLEPGAVLRLRPPKAPTHVEVQLGSGAKLSSFPEAAASGARPAGEAAWEPLPTPPRSGYRFEALLQRIAAELPPELLAAVEERRERGRRLAEARQAAAQQAAGAAVRSLGGTVRGHGRLAVLSYAAFCPASVLLCYVGINRCTCASAHLPTYRHGRRVPLLRW